MKPIELIEANASLIQALVDHQEYSIPISSDSVIGMLAESRSMPFEELDQIIREINESVQPVKQTLHPRVTADVGAAYFDCADGVIDLWGPPGSGKSLLCDKLIGEASRIYPDRKCMRLDCDGSNHISSTICGNLTNLEVFRVRTWEELICTLGFIQICISESSGVPPAVIIVDSVSTIFSQAVVAKLKRRDTYYAVLSRIVATARRINESGNCVVVLVNQTTTLKLSNPDQSWTIVPRLGALYRDILSQHPHKSIRL